MRLDGTYIYDWLHNYPDQWHRTHITEHVARMLFLETGPERPEEFRNFLNKGYLAIYGEGTSVSVIYLHDSEWFLFDIPAEIYWANVRKTRQVKRTGFCCIQCGTDVPEPDMVPFCSEACHLDNIKLSH